MTKIISDIFFRGMVILAVICLLLGCLSIISAEKINSTKINGTKISENLLIITKNTSVNKIISQKNVTNKSVKTNQTVKLNTTNISIQASTPKIPNRTPLANLSVLNYPPITLTPSGWETFNGLAKGCDSSCSGASAIIW